VLYVNGVQHPSEPPIMDCSSPFGATTAYKSLFSSIHVGIHYVGRAHMFTLEIFTEGFCVLGFDLTPNREADKEHIILPCQGKIRSENNLKNLCLNLSGALLCWISWTQRNRQLQKRYSRMNTLQVSGVLTKYVKNFQGIYPIDFLPITLI